MSDFESVVHLDDLLDQRVRLFPFHDSLLNDGIVLVERGLDDFFWFALMIQFPHIEIEKSLTHIVRN